MGLSSALTETERQLLIRLAEIVRHTMTAGYFRPDDVKELDALIAEAKKKPEPEDA